VVRLKPRFNADVNRWWICDAGRYGFAFVDARDRLLVPTRREGEAARSASWDEAITALSGALRQLSPDEIGVIASPTMANEDLAALRRLLDLRTIQRIGFEVPPRVPGDQDEILIRADKNPNSLGAALVGLGGDTRAVLDAARGRRLKCLWIFGHDLLGSAWPDAEVLEALRGVEMLVFTGTNANRTSARAHWVLPAAAWVERDGTYTNFEGRVQRFRPAVAPLGEALPEWEMLGRILAALGEPPSATRAEHWFRQLTGAVPAFAGLSYQSLGDTGRVIARATSAPA
jgi:predicted molibdopterin-dependent oxidoreductase YjgC